LGQRGAARRVGCAGEGFRGDFAEEEINRNIRNIGRVTTPSDVTGDADKIISNQFSKLFNSDDKEDYQKYHQPNQVLGHLEKFEIEID
jgi:hypothetical protein